MGLSRGQIHERMDLTYNQHKALPIDRQGLVLSWA